jgi:hypothetical protein
MTLAEATQTLIDEGYESNAEGISATIVFPDNSSFSVTGEQAGLSLDASEAAVAAFAFGREGSFFQNELTYIRALLNRTELNDLSTATFYEGLDGILRGLAAEYTQIFNDTLLDDNLEIDDYSITIVKGTGILPANENDVFDLAVDTLRRAVEINDHLTAHYTPKPGTSMDIDLLMLYDYISVEPVSSQYDKETLGATASSTGKTFDIEAAQDMIDNAATGQTVVIPILTVYPEFTEEQILSMILRDLLHSSTTRIGGTSNRLSNITLSARAIDGTVLQPGEVFSFNETVGKRVLLSGEGW